ncbi:Down syndrome critical region protein 3-like [Oopsacas minuta]|uniref:Vacuolar protein sorting-associated protein 26C n=1 Tax=Oopsacas minuta TaxID=111878 RepID=A0AAV7JMN7_9METZ|nr:Down syndrome critical region protein 3-like [Oopsacas minuta]
MSGPSIDIRLKRPSKTYKVGEELAGVVIIDSHSDLTHYGLTLTFEATANLQVSAKTVGLFEAFYSSLKPIQILFHSSELAKTGKFPSGTLEIPFTFPIEPLSGRTLYETYHGVFVNIQYILKCDMKRPLLSKDLQKICECVVQYKETDSTQLPLKPLEFCIDPGSVDKKTSRESLPEFRITGRIDSVNCSITKPFSGELTVEFCSASIKSIELQLIRVETCGCAEGYSKDPTEIQNIQIADGDVCHNVSIPIFMIFPRLFTCPSLSTTNFKIDFEVSIVVLLEGDLMLTENFPIQLTRN